MVFKALAHHTRRDLFERSCRKGERTVAVLTSGAGISQPIVHRYLGVLRDAGLVGGRINGGQTHYSAQMAPHGPLVSCTKEMAGVWESQFDALEDELRRMDQ